MKNLLAIFFVIFFSSYATIVLASEEHEHQHAEHEQAPDEQHKEKEKHEDDEHNHDKGEEHSDENATEITNAMAKKVGIELSQVGPQTLHQTFTTYGRLATAPEHSSHVRARFPGIVRNVSVNIGDQVKEGDLLAVIESNESLKRYDLRAPISGTIIQRHANKGEMTQDQILFSISSFESLWAELRIFSTQQELITIGQPVHIIAGEKRFDSRISHVLPAQEDSPYLIVRAQINNTKINWFPGLMVEGKVVIDEFDVPLSVSNSAIQTMNGITGVFVNDHENYSFMPLVLGRNDDDFTEVLSGVNAGEHYVVANSFLIKADIEKSEAEHEH